MSADPCTHDFEHFGCYPLYTVGRNADIQSDFGRKKLKEKRLDAAIRSVQSYMDNHLMLKYNLQDLGHLVESAENTEKESRRPSAEALERAKKMVEEAKSAIDAHDNPTQQ